MSTVPITSIIAILSKFGIAGPHQTSIASRISGTGRAFTSHTVELLLSHFAKNSGDAKSLTMEALDNGSWIALASDLADRECEARDAAAEAREKSDASRMEKVSESNPYGWDLPDQKREGDHNIPGTWNPFRQSYNLTAKEKLAASARDYRRRGCSRWEVLGGTKGGDTQSKVAYDALEVAKALGKDFGAVEPIGAPERKVYGE